MYSFTEPTLRCQGVSQLESGAWHLLIGDKASGLSEALERLVTHPINA